MDSAHVGQPRREGEIVDVVLSESDRKHYRVRWDDGHESVYFPSTDCRVVTGGEASSN